MLIVSGGKGSDERAPEAAAMAAYLTERGFPADQLRARGPVPHDRGEPGVQQGDHGRGRPAARRKGARCVIVTSNYHVFRTAIIARKAGIRGQVTGARTAGYYWPSAMLREFAAVFLRYWAVNLAMCAALVCVPVGYAALRGGV